MIILVNFFFFVIRVWCSVAEWSTSSAVTSITIRRHSSYNSSCAFVEWTTQFWLGWALASATCRTKALPSTYPCITSRSILSTCDVSEEIENMTLDDRKKTLFKQPNSSMNEPLVPNITRRSTLISHNWLKMQQQGMARHHYMNAQGERSSKKTLIT